MNIKLIEKITISGGMLLKVCGLILFTLILTSTTLKAAEDMVGFKQLLNKIEQVKDQYNIAGVGLVIVDENASLHEAYLGLASRENRLPVTDNTVFRVGSITKTFTSLAILKLVEQGKLDLNEKVSHYLSESVYTNTYPASPIRLAHLLEHTAGFHDMDKHEWEFKHSNWTLSQSLQYSPQSRTTAWQPGQYSSYSNSGAGVAGFVLEQVVDVSFEDFVQQHIFDPLGLHDATFYLNESIESRLATGYNTDGSSIIPYWNMLYRPFGALNMRVNEMATFIRFLINYGRTDEGVQLFSRQSIQRLEKPQTTLAARHGLEYGYGLGNYTWIRDGLVFHGHGGDADGYLAHYGYTRLNNKGYFLVINAFHGAALRTMRKHVEKWLASDAIKAPLPAMHVLDNEHLKNILGEYSAITKRFSDGTLARAKIFEKNGQLFTRVNKKSPIELIPVTNYHFRRTDQPVATISIVQDAAGDTVLQGDMGNFKRVSQ